MPKAYTVWYIGYSRLNLDTIPFITFTYKSIPELHNLDQIGYITSAQ